MFAHFGLRLILASLLVVGTATSIQAAPPWSSLIPFQRVEADIEKSYELNEDHGPWMIMAASFSGPGAAKDARNLVQELRAEFDIEAYTYKQHYDYSDTIVGKGYDRYGGPKKMRYMNDTSYTSYAVLVGNYDSVDDPNLQKTLDKIKTVHPQTFADGYSVKTDTIKKLREKIKEAISSDDAKEKGPMGSAFVSRNPILPEEFFRPKGVDKLLVNMNKDTPYSLLGCPGNYTVRVATFRGAVEIDPEKIEKIEKRKIEDGSRLARAAEKAEKLAAALRKQGVEAYTFHDRAESVVTVGSFASVGTRRKDGTTEINPQVLRVMEGYKGGSKPGAGPNGMTSYQPKQLAGIIFDVQPIPVEVPKVSIAADYARGALR